MLHYGLRTNLGTTAVLSLLYAGLFALVYRDPGTGEGAVSEAAAERNAREISLGSLVRQRKVWGVALGSGAYNYCFYLLLTWLPVYLELGVRMSARSAVLLSGVPWMVAAFADFAIGGVLVDSLIRRGSNPDRVRRAVLLGGTAFGLWIFAPAILHAPFAIVVCLTLAISGLAAAAPVLWTIPTLLSPPGGVGRLGSLINFVNQIAAISAPVVTGYLRSSTHTFGAAFAVAGVLLLLGIASYALLLGKIVRMTLPAPILPMEPGTS